MCIVVKHCLAARSIIFTGNKSQSQLQVSQFFTAAIPTRMSLKTNSIPDYIKFSIGGLSGIMTTLIVQPLDFIKTRMQISGQDGHRNSYRNNIDAIKQIIVSEGILAIYSGLTAALLRQATYTTAKLGIYTALYERYSIGNHQPTLPVKMFLGMIAGIVGSCIGTPSEIALIRMTADGMLMFCNV